MTLIDGALQNNTFIRCIWSNPRIKDQYQKIIMKPILIKDELIIQLAKTKDNKEYHENVQPKDLSSKIAEIYGCYKQIQLYTATQDYQCLINKKGV